MGPHRRAVMALLLLAGCGTGASAPDARPRSDARPGAATAQLGRCRVVGSETDCTGVSSELGEFSPLADDDEVPLVLGPQGSMMVVLGVRTADMDPGSDSPGSPENPEVDLRLYAADRDEELGRYRGRPRFAVDGVTVTAVGLFVVLDFGIDVAGAALDATVAVQDRQGQQRWGGVRLIAVP